MKVSAPVLTMSGQGFLCPLVGRNTPVFRRSFQNDIINTCSIIETLSKLYWGSHLWAQGYFATTSGTVTDETIMNYIENQDEDEEKRGDSFTILTTD